MSEVKEQNTIEILDESLKQGFTAIPRAILKSPKLSMQAKTLFALLLDYAWQKGSCFPGQERLAEDLNVHRNTISKHLLELKAFGFITWKQRGLNRTNIYYINPLATMQFEKADETNTFLESHSSVHPESHSDVNQELQPSVNIIKEVEYKKKEYKKPLTLGNANEQLNLNTFDSEALAIAKELNDEKSIKFYQKVINQKKKGEISDEDILSALSDTRRMVRTDQVDGKNFLKNPAGWFVSVLKKLTEKRKEKEQKAKVEDMLNKFHKSFASKAIVCILLLMTTCFSISTPVKAQETSEITIDSVFQEHNKVRNENGLPEFTLNEELTKSAYLKAVSMKFRKCWSHYCPDSPWGDFTIVGYTYDFAGENLAHGYTNFDDLMKDWLDSPTHKENVLNAQYSEIGIAVIEANYLTDNKDVIVVVHFAKPSLINQNKSFLVLQNQLFMNKTLCWSNY